MSQLLDAYGRPIQKSMLSAELAAPSLSGIRSVWNHTSVVSGLTPGKLAALLRDATEGNADAYLTLAEEMEEKDPHYASVLGTRKRAVARLPLVVEAASDAPEDVKLADEARALLARSGAKGMIEDLLDALGKGYSVVEIIWDKSATPWTPREYKWRDPRFFTYDRDTLSVLRLKDAQDPAYGIPLEPYKFLTHTPRLKSGLPIRGGLARLAAWTFMFKNYTVKDWVAFCEVFGMPLRLGKYRPGETEDNIRILQSAVANLGSDAAAVIPEGMLIEFVNGVSGTGGESLFERIATWFDKQLSKAVLGQTMTSDDGSSKSQAQVHDEVREDIRDADGEQLAETLERDLLLPYINLNWGVKKAYPRICFREVESIDIPVISEALAKLVPLGLRVEVSEVRDKLGFSDPAKGAECLAAGGGQGERPMAKGEGKNPLAFSPSPLAAGKAKNAETRQEFTAEQQMLEVLADKAIARASEIMRANEEALRLAVMNAASYEEAMQNVVNLYPNINLDRLTALLEGSILSAQAFGKWTIDNG